MSINLLPGHEPIIDFLVARLEEHLDEAITTVNAEDTKGITLDVPQVVDYVPTPSELHTLPLIAIEEGPSRLADDVGWGATGVGDLVVVVFFQHYDQRTLALSLRRYLRVIRSIALSGRELGPAWGVVDRGTRPGPTLSRPEDPQAWLSYAATMLEVRWEEDQLP